MGDEMFYGSPNEWGNRGDAFSFQKKLESRMDAVEHIEFSKLGIACDNDP